MRLEWGEALSIQDFTPEAEAAVQRCTQDYRERLIRESREIEQLQNPDGNDKQVTPAHVNDANLRLRKPFLSPRKTPVSVYIWAGITVVCSFVGGLGANNWSHLWGQILFIVMLVIGIFSGMAAVSKERQ
ncbi:hypothetical protein [Mycobacteroides abscessus]|uniref:hypothetical protein n=1 Tax=Mycobacteroides abscessus TaxID=36809 RepID=UPI002107A2F4|nr:hypothetical protein [Mycobacteroides abscessus]